MGKVEVDQVIINLSILKLCRFFHMIDPNSRKFHNQNVYRLLYIVFLAVNLCVLLVGQVGMFKNKDDTLNDIDLFQLMCGYIHVYLNIIKISVLLYNANNVWDLFDMTRLDFLKSEQCRKNINTLYVCRDSIIKASNYYFFAILVLSIQWMFIPLVVNAFDDTVNRRNQNILNIRFPVSIHTYNQYYVMFYVIELMVLLLSSYTTILSDMLIMSFGWVIIILYQILTKSFADIGYANKHQSEHYEDFKSILSDLIQLHLKLKSFYDVIRPIMLIYVGLSSCIIISITYILIMVCSSPGSYSAFEVLKLVSTAIYLYFELFLLCYLFDSINTNRDSVNFGMYSCSWTMMDLKFKKLLLLTMRMNNANQMVLKVSPKNIINLQLFANELKICYNIISVMLKTMNNNQK